MAGKNCLKTIKEKIILILGIVSLVCFSTFGFFACNSTTSGNYNDEEYNITVEDKGEIKNAQFSYSPDYKEFKSTEFPMTSPTGWTKNTDNSSASYVNSGTVSTSDTEWRNLLLNLYSNTTFSSYLKNKYSYTDIEVKTAINSENPNVVSSDEIKIYVIDHLLLGNDFLGKTNFGGDYKNPKCHNGASDNYIYMLNNYMSTDIGLGTAQKITSSSTVTLKVNKIYKLSVWVKIINITGINADGDFGANIRLTNNFSGASQAEYIIENIKLNPDDTENNNWAQYSVYINSDKDIEGSFVLSLGLGLGNEKSSMTNYFTEGTALFDDITFEEVDSLEAGLTTNNMKYGSSEKIINKANQTTKKSFIYDMSLSNSINYLSNGFSIQNEYTQSNITAAEGSNLTSKNITSDSNFTHLFNNGVSTLQLNKASVTLKLTNNNFVLSNDNFTKYMAVSFYMKSDLNSLYSNSITVDVIDNYNNGNLITEKRAKVATLSPEDNEFKKYTILIKNNFTTEQRSFSINLIIGPDNIGKVNYESELATGTVTFKDFEYYSNYSDEDAYITENYLEGKNNPEYKLYSLLEKNSTGKTALYAGYSEDYSNESNSDTKYNFECSPADIGIITKKSTAVKDYTGITYNHAYIKGSSNDTNVETEINDRTKNGTSNGVAGLINTSYLDNYNDSEAIKSAINGTYTDKIQPIMIYNKVEDSYGFISNTKSIPASTTATISAKIRVVGDAKAFIYLINTNSLNKTVMNFTDFTVNTDIVDDIENGKSYSANDNKFQFEITSDMMSADGWLNVSFNISTGKDKKDFRIEIWNGERSGENTKMSKGFVFIDSVNSTLSSAFKTAERWADAFSSTDSILYGVSRENLNLIAYNRELTSNELKFNSQYSDKAVSYNPNYVWASNKTFIYADFSTIDYVETNPFDNIDKEEEKTGCTAQTDPSTFWLSFSSIVLGVVLVLAIIVLFIKNLRRKHKYHAEDDKGNFKIQSKEKTHKLNQEKLSKQKEESSNNKENINETKENEESNDESIDQKINEENNTSEVKPENQDLDSYVYGEVNDFGDNDKDKK